MKPLPEQIHIVTFAGSPENGFQALRFKPMSHLSYVDFIAHYRLPPPHGWAVLHMTPAEHADPDSTVNKSLFKYEATDGTGAAAYLKAAVDDLFQSPELAEIVRLLYKVDFAQYPAGYTVIGNIRTLNQYSALDSLNLLFIAGKVQIEGKIYLDVKPTQRGELAAEALNAAYGTY